MTSATRRTLALFPLNTVLFPGGPLPLRIFEARYIDLVRRGPGGRVLREDVRLTWRTVLLMLRMTGE